MEMEKRKGNKNRETINQKLTKLVVQVKFKLRHDSSSIEIEVYNNRNTVIKVAFLHL